MTKPLYIAIICLLAALTAGAQTRREKVELLVVEENTAIFCAEGFASSKKEALENAKKATLRQLLYDGVQDFNEGEPIVLSGHETNLWLNEFFDGKQPAYKAFVSDVELVGDFITSPSGEVSCTANVVIKHAELMHRAENQGLRGETPPQNPAPSQQQSDKRSGKTTYL